MFHSLATRLAENIKADRKSNLITYRSNDFCRD